MDDAPQAVSASLEELRDEVERLRLLHTISLEFSNSLDFDELLPRVFHRVLTAVGAQGGSIWITEGDELRCRLALGASSQSLIGTTVPIGTGFVGDVARKQRSTLVTRAMEDPRFQPRAERLSGFVTTTVMAAPMIVDGATVGSIEVSNKTRGDGIFDEHDREVLEGLAASAAVALRNAQLVAAEKRARDLEMLLEISREITSTLDLDRVLSSVVNLAARALPFDQAAVGLFGRGACEIRAIAGEESVDAKDPRTQRLAMWGEWVARRGEPFYLSDRHAPGTDAEVAFVNAFGDDLAGEGLTSGLYLPLHDEQGLLGVLIFESRQPEFLSPTQRELAEILANQTTVALRNAELYHEVPMVDALGALGARKRALMAMPRRRRLAYAAGFLAGIAALVFIQWPLRVVGAAPAFRAAGFAEVHALAAGVLEQVLVREGATVPRGAPLARLRDADLVAERASALADADGADRMAASASSHGDVASERAQRARAAALRQQAAILDEEIAATTLRAPAAGVILTPRPEERIGAHFDAGDAVLALGRTDTLELDFAVEQRDIGRVAIGQPVHARVDALPQRTFDGVVTFIGPVSADSGAEALFPVRAMMPNSTGLLKPGMAAHARVLTARASIAERVFRGPVRWWRLAWWRFWA